MKIGICCAGIGPAANGDFIRNTAVAAEQAGFSAFWIAEHVVLFDKYPESKYPYAGVFGGDIPIPDPRTPMTDPVVSMTWAAAATSKIEVGSGIIILPQRNPVVLAKELSTLDVFCNGRVVLGVGVGWCKEEYDAIGADWPNRGKVTDEYVGALRTLWRDERSDFTGDHITFRGTYLYPKPISNDIPILIGGESDLALSRAARIGDGWLAFNLPVEKAAPKVAKLKQCMREQDRAPDSLRIVTNIFLTTSDDDIKRYRDAGITEFVLNCHGEIPLDAAGTKSRIADFGRYVEMVASW
jgi:probable F420-dependent oxidoreductase